MAAAAAAGGDAAGAAAGSMGVIARLAELFLSRRCRLGWKSIKFSLFAVANALLHHYYRRFRWRSRSRTST